MRSSYPQPPSLRNRAGINRHAERSCLVYKLDQGGGVTIRGSDRRKNMNFSKAGRMKRSAMKWSKGVVKSVGLDAF